LIELDDRELHLAVAQADAEIEQIAARISMEEGQQDRARRDVQRLPGTLTDSQRQLVLRAPQMAALQAELAAAEAARERAMVELSHAVIRAPFDAIVISEEVAMGSVLSAGSEAASLVGAEEFDVMLAVPVSALDWINPQLGQTVRLSQPGVWPEGSFREGRIERLIAGLRTTGRMAELVITIDDPLARLPQNRGKPRLLLGSFLRAVGEGRKVEGAVSLDRAYLHGDDTVWVITPDSKLEIRPVTVAWRGAEQVLISGGLVEGERIVTTPLAIVAPGMELRIGAEAGQ
jgi:RND family efflux transporter MFP subunit